MFVSPFIANAARGLAVCAIVAAFAASVATPSVSASTLTGTARGTVVASDGTHVADATVTLRSGARTYSARTSPTGAFVLDDVPAGTYALEASASGYTTLKERTVEVTAGGTASLELVLSRQTLTSLTTIGQVRANGAQTLSASSAPSTELNAQTFAAQGYTRVSDVLDGALSTTVLRPLGGGANSPAVVALRGPDPTETLVDIDGHEVNNGNSGDFDLSLLDPADFQSVQIVYGIAPSSLVGPNTLGGAINIRTIEPTTTPHGFARLSGGSYATFLETLQATGTRDRLGYAFSLHRTTSAGETNNQTVVDSAGDSSNVGSAVNASTALAKVRYGLGGGDGFVDFTLRAQSVYRDLSAALTSIVPAGASGNNDRSAASDGAASSYDSFAGSSLQAHNVAYGFDLQVPLGGRDSEGIVPTTMLLRHLTSSVSQSVFGPAADTSPYLYNDRDLVGDDTLEFDRQSAKDSLSLKLDLRTENLNTDFVAGLGHDQSIGRLPFADTFAGSSPSGGSAPSSIALGQTQRSIALRYSLDPTAKIHYTFATYYSDFSTFGTSFDPRAGFVWTPKADSVLRFSVGTTFQSPQLTELYLPPNLPPPVNGYISVGNPNLRPDHATEYDLGYEHLFGTSSRRTHVAIDLYRTNLRTPSTTYFPPTTCGSSPGSKPNCLSFPVNVGGAVYQGMELRADRDLAAHTTLHATYGVDSTFVSSVPAFVSDGSIVVGLQSLGVPLHKATLSLEHSPATGLAYFGGIAYEGQYNELNQPPFATLRAGLTWHAGRFDVGLSGTNLTNVYDDKFTRVGAGVPYGGNPTDAYVLGGRTITLWVTRHY
ncbi:MAG: TonB-dependent receptor [Candidatus Baltobacteraceae bacterium]